MSESNRTSGGSALSEFTRRLLECEIISDRDLDQAQRSLDSTDEITDDALAKHLLQSGRLTEYQVNLVREGKHAEAVIGNYEVLDRLGAGMGAVFKARHRRMKRVVALKIMSGKLAGDQTFVQRFQREVETIARLQHPNIVMAFDADVCEAGHYLVMEFVDGRDLDSLVTRQGPLSVAAALDCVLQAALGLEYVHGQGMMHRDIKPANLLRDAQGTVKVTDLGLARFSAANTDVTGITQAGGVVGTVDYMPPEQAIDATQIDHRADIYSLGGTLHFLLTGQPPYPEKSLMAALLKHREAAIPSLRMARPDVPAELDAVFCRMMAKVPADRFQSMSDVIRALKAVQAGLGETTGAVFQLGGTIVSPAANIETTPLTRPDATGQTIAHGRPNVPSPASPKVVLVEPSRTQSAIIRKYLSEKGIDRVSAVASGKDALAAVATDRPDVIVCALHLSDMTGRQLAQQLRSAHAVVPGFVLISSEADHEEAGSLSKYGNGIVLQKPFTPEKLAEALSLVAAPKRNPEAERGKLRVLIVDDSAAVRLHVRGTLKDLGLTQFVDAADGAQAVAVLARERFDLIVTDYNMPFMDGGALVGYIKQNPTTAAVPIIMVTTETDAAKLDAVRQLGVTVCDKSFPPALVRKILEQIAVAP